MMGLSKRWKGGRVLLLAWLAFGLVGISGVASADSPKAPLRVGIAPIYPPLAFKKGGSLEGIEPAFAERLSERLGRPIAFTELPWADLLVALRDGRIDVVMSGMSVTAARKQQARFIEPYLEVGQMALIRNEDFERLSPRGALNKKGVRVGFLRDTTSEEYVSQALVDATLTGFDTSENGISALRNSQIDAWVQDAPGIWRVTGGFFSKEEQLRGLYTPRTEEHLAWAVRLGDDALGGQLDEAVKAWKADGTVEDVIDDWIRVRKTTIEVIPPES